jgi:hypothetical protein
MVGWLSGCQSGIADWLGFLPASVPRLLSAGLLAGWLSNWFCFFVGWLDCWFSWLCWMFSWLACWTGWLGSIAGLAGWLLGCLDPWLYGWLHGYLAESSICRLGLLALQLSRLADWACWLPGWVCWLAGWAC